MLHVDKSAQNKSGIAYQGRCRRPRDRCCSKKGSQPAAEAATKRLGAEHRNWQLVNSIKFQSLEGFSAFH
jgi:hypothetical protein